MTPDRGSRSLGAVPDTVVPRVVRERRSALPAEAGWSVVPPLELRRSEDGATPAQSTAVRIAHDDRGLFLRFECRDEHIRATYTRRDAPLWEEEVVELFIAPGDDDPVAYFEFEINPLGTIFDARVLNPVGERGSMKVDSSWNAPGLTVAVDRPSPAFWRASMAIPWGDLLGSAPLPSVWRANLFRIDRPPDGGVEHSAWSPTLVRPADFHKPGRFGRLRLDRANGRT